MNKIYLIVSICFFAVIFASCGESSSTEEKPGSQQNSSLIWSVKSSNKLNWQEAKDYCRNLTEREQSDWHLPTIEELRDLIQSCPGTITGGSCAVSETCAGGYCLDESCQACSPETDGSYSRLGDTNQLWSATSLSNHDPAAWYVDFSNAGIYMDGKENYRYVRCTRIVKGTERKRDCQELPDKAAWNTVSEITQTWNGEEWVPSTTASYNEEASSAECRFKCMENYEWNGADCVNAKRNAECTGLPENAEWNTVSSITQTWNDEDWVPETAGSYNTNPSSTECRFKCNTNYSWKNSRCAADKRTVNCTEIPENAEWNTVSTITQTWSGSAWLPSNTSIYNESPSTNECRFKCKTNYSSESCTPETKEYICPDKPANSSWNSVSHYLQTWNGEEWLPQETETTYNKTPSTTECRFKCNANYIWKDSQCKAGTKTVNCTEIPENAEWNNGSTVFQTWNGSTWFPSNVSSYSENPDSNECTFKCIEEHFWRQGACISPCDNEPCSDFENAENECKVFAWNRYICTCRSSYYWSGTKKGCSAERPVLGNICTGRSRLSYAAYNYGEDSEYGICVPKNFSIEAASENENIVVDNNTGLMWQQTVPGETLEWTTAENYCNNLVYGNYDGWRLPTTHELLTIVDFGKYFPAVDTTYFPDTSDSFWTSDPNGSYHLGVSFNLGMTNTTLNSKYVRCVKGEKMLLGNLASSSVNGAGIVEDSATGFMWQGTYTSQKTWSEALQYCEDLTYAGYSNWRLPNINELASIVTYEQSNPASEFPDMPASYFWSSTFDAYDYNRAWGIKFKNGEVMLKKKGEKFNNFDGDSLVRCVR